MVTKPACAASRAADGVRPMTSVRLFPVPTQRAKLAFIAGLSNSCQS
jgi:hypothetical protein